MAKIFIGSSAESKDVAKALELALEGSHHQCTVWEFAFTASAATLDELIRNLEHVAKTLGITVPIPFGLGSGNDWARASYGYKLDKYDD